MLRWLKSAWTGAAIAYAAGKPAYTVGAGNVVAIVDETVDVAAVAKKIARSKTFDNASGCSMENAVAAHSDVYEKLLAALQAEGGYLCAPDERERLRHTLWPDGRTLNREIVARSARQIAALAGLGVPETTRLSMVAWLDHLRHESGRGPLRVPGGRGQVGRSRRGLALLGLRTGRQPRARRQTRGAAQRLSSSFV